MLQSTERATRAAIADRPLITASNLHSQKPIYIHIANAFQKQPVSRMLSCLERAVICEKLAKSLVCPTEVALSWKSLESLSLALHHTKQSCACLWSGSTAIDADRPELSLDVRWAVGHRRHWVARLTSRLVLSALINSRTYSRSRLLVTSLISNQAC